jgi:hypothetical protein
MQQKVWVVALTQGQEVTQAAVFDNESDAENYAQEMISSEKGNYQILSSVLSSRKETEEETHWAALPDFDSGCIECLFEEISAVPGEDIDAEACTKFLEEHKVDFQKKADEIVQEYLRKEIRDYLFNERVILG